MRTSTRRQLDPALDRDGKIQEHTHAYNKTDVLCLATIVRTAIVAIDVGDSSAKTLEARGFFGASLPRSLWRQPWQALRKSSCLPFFVCVCVCG